MIRLPPDQVLLVRLQLSFKEVTSAILERRATIRYHRDQKGDDRCWLDDFLVWDALIDSPPVPVVPPPFEEAMRQCDLFYRFRRANGPDPVPLGAILDKRHWDNDLRRMVYKDRVSELAAIQKYILQHRDIFDRPRTIDDDRMLYSNTLPEKIPADFRLPPKGEFLGGAKAPNAGCPSFWRSHNACPSRVHCLSRWGPCV